MENNRPIKDSDIVCEFCGAEYSGTELADEIGWYCWMCANKNNDYVSFREFLKKEIIWERLNDLCNDVESFEFVKQTLN
jgi:hypothetical protein